MKTCRLFVGVIALLTLLSSSLAQTQEDYFTNVRTFSVREEGVTRKGGYSVIGVDSVPGIPHCRFILLNRSEVTYLDGQSEVLSSRFADRDWTLSMSPDGSKIAYIEHPRSSRPVTLRVESAVGDVLWERSDGYGIGEDIPAKILVNNEGAVVVAPTLLTGDRMIVDGRSGTRSYPLLFDGSGELTAELPVRTEACLFDDSLSPDGLYYAINFSDIEADSTLWCWQGRGGLAHRGKNCVAVFDMRTGAELWRHYFDHCGHGSVVIGPGADAVVTGGRDQELRLFGEGHSLYFFDRYGQVKRKHPVLFFRFAHLTMSPSGKYVAGVIPGGLASSPRPERLQGVAVVFEASSGDLYYEYYEASDPTSQILDLHISDNAELFLRVRYSEPGEGLIMRKHILLGRNGQILWQRAKSREQSQSASWWLAPDGRRLVEIDKNMEMRVHSR